MSANLKDEDAAWQHWRDQWPIRPDTVYLNHGSFGPPPKSVIQCQQQWQQRLACQPMDFFVRELETEWIAARDRLAAFLGANPACLAFVENASSGMNAVANSFPLQSGDEVLLTDHEYGAVFRIWQREVDLVPGAALITAALPPRFNDVDEVVASIFAAATNRTRIIVVSHITSPTAVILPVQKICEEAHRRGIAVCIDGPHAPAQLSLSFRSLPCDFYVASLHKWVSAPFGSGFLYVAPQWQAVMRTPLLCWGRVSPTKPNTWWDEFLWSGTRDPSPYLASSAALDLLEQVGLENFRTHTHALARYARQQIVSLTQLEPATADSDQWYGSMVSLPLPAGDAAGLQRLLWQRHRIEIPVVAHNDQRSIRVSCHLYNNHQDLDYLVASLKEELAVE